MVTTGIFALPKTTLLRRTHTRLSPWVTLTAREILREGEDKPSTFHSLAQADYVSVLAITAEQKVLLVEQYRPALETVTLELPGGLRDGDEEPAACALRELAEETGYESPSDLIPLGQLSPDSGRLENRLWCFFAPELRRSPEWLPEPGVSCLEMTKAEFEAAILSGRFNHALHIAIVGMARLRGCF